jgi:hypothetical protein
MYRHVDLVLLRPSIAGSRLENPARYHLLRFLIQILAHRLHHLSILDSSLCAHQQMHRDIGHRRIRTAFPVRLRRRLSHRPLNLPIPRMPDGRELLGEMRGTRSGARNRRHRPAHRQPDQPALLGQGQPPLRHQLLVTEAVRLHHHRVRRSTSPWLALPRHQSIQHHRPAQVTTTRSLSGKKWRGCQSIEDRHLSPR